MVRNWFSILAVGFVIALCASSPAAEPIPGPVPARVVRVIDGDTLKVEARIWIGQYIVVNARIRGIDTPELRGDCAAEIENAKAAREALEEIVSPGPVRLLNVDQDKFGGRVVADVTASESGDVATNMLESGHARPYSGGKRQPWCRESG